MLHRGTWGNQGLTDAPSTAFNTDFKALTSLFFGKMDAGEEVKGLTEWQAVSYQKENEGRERVGQRWEAGGSGRRGRAAPRRAAAREQPPPQERMPLPTQPQVR